MLARSEKRMRRGGAGLAVSAALALLGCGSGDDAGPPAATAPQPSPPAATAPAPPEPVAPAPPAPPASPPEAEAAAPPPRREPPFVLPPDASTLPGLPEDIPVPENAQALHPPLLSDEGVTHASYELDGSVATARTFYTSKLLAEGWAMEPGYGGGSEAAILARKGDRQLSITMAEIGGRTHVVILESPQPLR